MPDVVLIKAGVEDADNFEGLELGNEADDRIQFALRTGDDDLVSNLNADLVSEVLAQNKRGHRSIGHGRGVAIPVEVRRRS